jgi:F-type H+-transporting ATPase subunit delta
LKSFKKIISNRKGEISAEIETAEALPEKDKTSIKNDLQSSYKANINAEFKINEKLISGSRIKIGSLMVDNSLQSKLNKILKGV